MNAYCFDPTNASLTELGGYDNTLFRPVMIFKNV